MRHDDLEDMAIREAARVRRSNAVFALAVLIVIAAITAIILFFGAAR
jgi:hypothetical protein